MKNYPSQLLASPALIHRHRILEDIARLRGTAHLPQQTANIQVVPVSADGGAWADLIQPNSMVLFVAPAGHPVEVALRDAGSDQERLVEVLSDMANKLSQVSLEADTLGHETPLRHARLDYQSHTVVPNLILDPLLGFNLVAVDFQGGLPGNEGFSLSELAESSGANTLQGILFLRPAPRNANEAIADTLTALREDTIELDFSPQASIWDDVKHTAEDVGKGVGKIGKGAANIAEGAYKTAKKADIGGDVEQAAENFGEYDAGRYHYIPEVLKHTDLNDYSREYSVEELLDIRNALIKAGAKRNRK